MVYVLDPDEIYAEYGKKLLTETAGGLDERAKFMITTCATLVVVQFGLSFVFNVEPFSFTLTPQFFLVISAAFFAKSLYYVGRTTVDLQSSESLHRYYMKTTRSKYRWHSLGLSFFIVGMLVFAIITFTQG
jgi:hypothetical protein